MNLSDCQVFSWHVPKIRICFLSPVIIHTQILDVPWFWLFCHTKNDIHCKLLLTLNTWFHLQYFMIAVTIEYKNFTDYCGQHHMHKIKLVRFSNAARYVCNSWASCCEVVHWFGLFLSISALCCTDGMISLAHSVSFVWLLYLRPR